MQRKSFQNTTNEVVKIIIYSLEGNIIDKYDIVNVIETLVSEGDVFHEPASHFNIKFENTNNICCVLDNSRSKYIVISPDLFQRIEIENNIFSIYLENKKYKKHGNEQSPCVYYIP